MKRPVPVLQEIRDHFDHYGETFGDRSETSSIKIEPTSQGYAVTSYPKGTYGYEGFTSNVTAAHGVFGQEGPSRVEMSRTSPGVIRVSVGEVTTDDDGFTQARMTAEPNVAREGLLLPGDPGFELFDQLHAELGARRDVVAEALGTLGVNIEPSSITYLSQNRSAGRYDHVNRIATHERETHIEVSGLDRAAADNVYAHIDLDGSQTSPFQADGSIQHPPEWPIVYRSGEARFEWEETFRVEEPQIGDEALLAFASLHATFATLYR